MDSFYFPRFMSLKYFFVEKFITEKYIYSLPLKIFYDVCLWFYFLDQNVASHLCIFRENPGFEKTKLMMILFDILWSFSAIEEFVDLLIC